MPDKPTQYQSVAVDLNVEPDNDGHDGDYNLDDDFEEEELEDAEGDDNGDGQEIIDEIDYDAVDMEIMEEQMIQDQIDALTMIEDLEYEQERDYYDDCIDYV